ncbi:MAG: hypothetical protein M1823_001035 [Watsoniomyces obsoletus]|nr:MAG: hypothetical protein M1823_001035 [Watsoniomyces obsoletus]
MEEPYMWDLNTEEPYDDEPERIRLLRIFLGELTVDNPISSEGNHHDQDTSKSGQPDEMEGIESDNTTKNAHINSAASSSKQPDKMEGKGSGDAQPANNNNNSAASSSNTQPGSSTKYSEGPATLEQILEWLMELLELRGEIGMRDGYTFEQIADILGPISADPEPPASPSSALEPDDRDANGAMGGMICEKEREEWLAKTTNEHRALFPEVVQLVERKLVSHGVPEIKLVGLTPHKKLDILHWIMTNEEYGWNISPLSYFDEPVPKFILYLLTTKDPKGGSKDTTKMYFQWDTSFVEFLGSMRDATSYPARRTGREMGYCLNDGPWLYQPLGIDKKPVPGSKLVEIKDEESFKGMIKDMKDKGLEMVLMIHSETKRLFDQAAEREAEYRKEEEAARLRRRELVDEDGIPIFEDEIDWDEIVREFRMGGYNGDGIVQGMKMFQ